MLLNLITAQKAVEELKALKGCDYLWPRDQWFVIIETTSGAVYYVFPEWSYRRNEVDAIVYRRGADGSVVNSFHARAVRVGEKGELEIAKPNGRRVITTPVRRAQRKPYFTKGAPSCRKELRTYDEQGFDGGGSVQCLAPLDEQGRCPREADHNGAARHLSSKVAQLT